jgi:membrane associated rhomboid family serine protease
MFLPYHDENPTQRLPWVTLLLIAINIWCYVGVFRKTEEDIERTLFRYGFVPLRLTQAFTGKPVLVDSRYLPAAVSADLEREARVAWMGAGDSVLLMSSSFVRLDPVPLFSVLWSMLTCMFLHGGLGHLVGNMWFFWLFGNNVEDRFGPLRFVIFYLAGGLVATLAHYVFNPLSPVPTVGASGAISAIMGAYLLIWPWARVWCVLFLGFFFTRVALPAWILIVFWFMEQILGVLGSIAGTGIGGVAWWAHLGGFVSGIFLTPFFLAPPEPRRKAIALDEEFF